MKKILLLWLFSCSLDGFSQSVDTTQLLRQFDVNRWPIKLPDTSVRILTTADFYPKADTIRALLLVTNTRAMRVSYCINGFVIFNAFNEPAYLNDWNQKLDPRLTVWQYKLITNELKRKRRAKQ